MNEFTAASGKAELRASLKQRRDALSFDPELSAGLNAELAELCLINGAKKISCYLAFGNEPDTELFIDWALDQQIEVLAPVSKESGELEWIRFDGVTAPGIFGFHEPVGEIVDASDVDLMIVPALAIDQKGNRIGKGKGFYDRYLATLTSTPPLVAVVYDEELLESIPAEPHDKPIDAVVTPSQTVRFNQRLK
ncbi:5-formyltetrahydrofolate cyclo-ligase [Rhodoluna sp.]|uniref:5-formyltetrahydrofolate cyclo-ligase n=1 Tax=Rhodoluna sp. TaxID=1969481 RepID=UPI0025CFFFA0|nr:5-formyltetrahydrofolate cyclo-ligase [Rhodoluna sp.]